MKRAKTIDELKPLLALCRAGRLFDVQEWVKSDKPVALPNGTGGKLASQNPLRIAMDHGFHSLVQVLLEGGAPQHEGRYNALEHAVTMRRPDIAALLLEHGAKAADVPMQIVIGTWQPEMVEL